MLSHADIDAARRGDLRQLKLIVEDLPYLINGSARDNTLLTAAASHGQLTAVKLLLVSGADVNGVGTFGTTPLSCAAINGHLDVLRTLLDTGAAVDIPDLHGHMPLVAAASRGHAECVKLLSAYGASRAPSPDGRGAEFWARVLGRHDLGDWLEATAHWTPLHHIEQLTPERAARLIGCGADVYAGVPSPLERARQVGGEVGEVVVAAATAVAAALSSGDR